MRVVFDTNIFVSALTMPGGKAEDAVMGIIEGEDTLIISREIIGEVLTVLVRKFGRDAEELSRVAVTLANLGELVIPAGRLNVLDDEADNRILECAVAGKAEAVVTGDKAMLKLKKYGQIRTMSLHDFLKRQQR